MKLRTLIIDDEPIALEKLRKYVEKVPFLTLVGACRNGLEATALMAAESVDVVFTDINMPDMSGLDFIGSLTTPPLVVFITAYANYAVDSYRFSAVDYLLKPYGFADFQRAANKVLEQYTLRSARTAGVPPAEGSLFIKTDYRYIRVPLSDIRYIKGYGEYLQIYTKSAASPLLTLSSFNAIKERLAPCFIQVHRSYIVNMECVRSIEKGRIIMDADTYIPIGDSYKASFQEYLMTHSVGATQKK
ncbi:MAG: LytTR family DNA-binding domain-containing protein [Muribaculaceae bacterium]|nr:LytTR family DNA-binding domain-containing protein [Muribaculaceae bacterium]